MRPDVSIMRLFLFYICFSATEAACEQISAPTLAIDLPLKALIAEDESGKVWVTYNSPEYLQQRHGVPEELIKNIAVTGALVAKAVE